MRIASKIAGVMAAARRWSCLVAAAACLGAGAGAAGAQVSYAPDMSAFANPERGWMWTNQPFCAGTTPIGFVDFDALRDAGVTLIDQVYVLDDYLNAPLSSAFLGQFADECDRVRSEGFKMVPRFTYNWIAGCSGVEDAAENRLIGHLAQLAPVFEANQDVIAMFQVSFIGRYGEMHTSTQGHVDPGTVMLSQGGMRICDALLDSVPASRSWAMRYPQARAQRHPVPLDASGAYGGTDDARTGLANHGFATDPTDYGTWNADPAVRAAEQAYAAAVSRWTPMLGEPSGALFGLEATPQEALEDTERFHFTAMVVNQGDALATGVYDDWTMAGVFEVMSRRLGYRYRMVRADRVVDPAGRNVIVKLRIANDGFAAPINARRARLVLRGDGGRPTFALETNIRDIRRDFPGPGETRDVRITATVPAEVAEGAYELLLEMPDDASSLAGRPEYAIRLANAGVWEASTGFNRLGLRMVVGGAGLNPRPSSGFQYFPLLLRWQRGGFLILP